MTELVVETLPSLDRIFSDTRMVSGVYSEPVSWYRWISEYWCLVVDDCLR
jgi:hypothetical protein